MPTRANGIWKALALSAMAALQGLCFWTLTEIRGDIRTMRADQEVLRERAVKAEAQLAIIVDRHKLEDTKAAKVTP